MINRHDLTDKDIGKWVEYINSHGLNEIGRLKGWNSSIIFVVFSCDGNWNDFKNYTGQSVRPTDLEFVLFQGFKDEQK